MDSEFFPCLLRNKYSKTESVFSLMEKGRGSTYLVVSALGSFPSLNGNESAARKVALISEFGTIDSVSLDIWTCSLVYLIKTEDQKMFVLGHESLQPDFTSDKAKVYE